MKGKSRVAAALFVAAMLATATLTAPAAAAQDAMSDVTDMQALRAAVKTDRRAFVASTLALSEAEAKKFWPLYDNYHRALDVANRQRAVILEEVLGRGKPPSDLYAKNLANELIAADEAEVKARRKLQSAVMRALPPRKAVRYLQLESKIRAYQAYDIASTFPLMK
jgi:Spy/CpxP family protein refolding chaperone